MKYRDLLFDREAGPLILAINIGRLASGLVPFGLIAYFASSDAYLYAGLASSLQMITGAVSAPWKGRLITRWSPVRTLIPLSLGSCVTTCVGIAISYCGGSIGYALALIALGTLLAPPTQALLRSLWTRLSVSDEMTRALHALDSTAEELTFAITPLVTSAFWATIGAFWSIPTGLLCGLVGNVAIIVLAGRRNSSVRDVVLQPQVVAAEDTGGSHRRRFGSLLMRRNSVGILVPMFGLGVAMGGMSLLLPKWAGDYAASQSVSGVMLSIISAAGCLSGLIYGKRGMPGVATSRQYAVACLGVSAGMLVLCASQNIVVVVVSMLLIGIGMTPMFIISYVLVGELYPDAQQTEFNALLGSSYDLGSGAAGFVVGSMLAALSFAMALTLVSVVVLALCLHALLVRPASTT